MDSESRARRGTLRVYLGAAPGVGKTYAMLGEGLRRASRGTDVVVGLVETHGRAHTAELVAGLATVPRRVVPYRGSTLEEMDVDALLTRRPEVAMVDELAHTNAPGSRNAKRWQDVEELLTAGIDVITTVNIQHLESLNDVVATITGIRQQETLPDEIVRRADQVQLVDMTAEALRRRMAHGNIYTADKIDAALANYFRAGNLSALRELALLWVADRVDDALDQYRADHDIDTPWPTRERVVVALSGSPEGEHLLRRGARITQRASGAELLALHVSRGDGLTAATPADLARQRALTETLGGSFHTVVGDDIADEILGFARGVNATHVVLGAGRRRGPLWSGPVQTGVPLRVVHESGEIDVHLVTRAGAGGDNGGAGRRPSRRGALGGRRLLAGWLLAVLAPALLTIGLAATREQHGLTIALMLFLTLTVAVALVGGLWPAVFAAVAGGLLANYYFTPPLYTFTIAQPENAFTILLLVITAVAVSVVVDLAARKTVQAARARAEADTLAVVAGSVLRGHDALPSLLNRFADAIGAGSVSLLQRADHTQPWLPIGAATSAAHPVSHPVDPAHADLTFPVREGLVLAVQGGPFSMAQMRVASAVAAQTEVVLERDRLREDARAARREHERTAIRTTLLAAVSHDLRTPLAGIKAAVSSLRDPGTVLDPHAQTELLESVESGADRLQVLIDNLLDLSRLDSGVITPVLGPVAVEDIIARALAGVLADSVQVSVPAGLPLVHGDAGLLERCLGNVVENAVRYARTKAPVTVSADAIATSPAGPVVVVRVIDHGPGVPDALKKEIFRAFQRSDDAPRGRGLGLGLAVARGFAEANGATLEAEDTPGSGLTMVLTLPPAPPPPPSETHDRPPATTPATPL